MRSTPSASGIYVVSLSNEHPISVNADRPIADRCIFVTKANCKYGRAKDLARRERNYIKTFGAVHVSFEVVVLTDSAAAIESRVAALLAQYRVKGQAGRSNEWLLGVTPAEVKQIILQVAADHPVAPAAPQPARRAARLSRVAQSAVSVSPAEVVAAAEYLRSAGMPPRLLKDMHHFPQRTETYASTIRYFSRKSELQPINILYGARLRHVAERHRESSIGFEHLVLEALAKYPLSADA